MTETIEPNPFRRALASLAPGVVLDDRYRLVEQIGRGGMAQVWRAEHVAIHRPVAVKFLMLSGDPAVTRARFLREARVAAAVRHRYVVDVLDFGTAHELPYLVMELLPGRTLADRLDAGETLSLREIVRLVARVLSGLDAVHAAGIVHGDIKPENVALLMDEGSEDRASRAHLRLHTERSRGGPHHLGGRLRGRLLSRGRLHRWRVQVRGLHRCGRPGGAPADAWSPDAYRCEDGSACGDGEECNGAERCTDGACASGMGLPDGSACEGGTGECVAGRCVPNECTSALECDDGDVCTGAERCEALRCVRGPVPICDDADACTADACPSPSGCTHTLIDEAGDGHAPTSLGACGTDCDDTRREVAPDAVEICGNSRDDDCDGTMDEAPTTTWYEDCDGDGFARAGARAIMACARPASSVSTCVTGGGWTAPDPSGESDCNDDNADVNPGQRTFQTSAISGAAASDDYDYNCDRIEERISTSRGRCERTLFSCIRTEGWVGGTPECGATAEWVTGCRTTLTGCATDTGRRPQACL